MRQPNGTYAGVMVDYLDEYAKKLNFTYVITKLMRHDEDAGGHRYIYPDATMWTGAVGDILQQVRETHCLFVLTTQVGSVNAPRAASWPMSAE
jgi:hypothetical protein